MDSESSISKVTGEGPLQGQEARELTHVSAVEYHDPSGVFPLISRQLQANLPLRDLHWKSPNRPLRSIEFLHVNLVAALDPGRPESRNAPSLTDGSPARTPGERRHQIPGLRQTPYLKIYLLRCDDNDAYKSQARKTLREWLKLNTPASQSSQSKNAQENHDAFEWMIIHVVLPNTPAAAQPRISKSSSKTDAEPVEKSATGGKLLGRSSSTILEKIKADFNVSSKSAPDRVAQIRLQIEELPQSLVPVAAPKAASDVLETTQERSNAWQDVVSKLKTLILLSFNLRVAQYEEDIRERDAQRALPGWNFCLFFMLKEGLACGFESVGLMDDALIGYDELSVGLDNAINEATEDGTTTRSDSFLKYTKDMKDILLDSLTSDSTPDSIWKSGTKIVSTTRKDYRHLIVNSNVSVFDFQCYIFARQMALLLRMGILHSTERPVSRTRGQSQDVEIDADNFGPLSELCQRASAFISAASRTLRDELLEAGKAQGVDSPLAVVENITASFAFAVAQQVLDATAVPALARAEVTADKPDARTTMDRLQHPARKSSLLVQSSPSPKPAVETPLALLKRLEERFAPKSADEEPRMLRMTDLESLAGNRADLLLLQRRILDRLAQTRGSSMGVGRLRELHTRQRAPLTEVDLNAQASDSTAEHTETLAQKEETNVRGVLFTMLLEALASPTSLTDLFKKITLAAVTQCFLACRTNTIEQLVADLAVIKYDAGDYAAAASYLQRILRSQAGHGWELIETELVKIYAQALKELKRSEEYVRTLLDLLGSDIERKKARKQLRLNLNRRPGETSSEEGELEGLLRDLLDVSTDLSDELAVPFDRYFGALKIDPFIQHPARGDGFMIDIKLEHLMQDDFEIDSVRFMLRSKDPPFRQVWLESEGPVELSPGINNISLHAHISCLGIFAAEKLEVKAKKLCFETEAKQSRSSTELGQAELGRNAEPENSTLSRVPDILCYPRSNTADLSVEISRQIHVDKPRDLLITLRPGTQDVLTAKLVLKAASAGLRLRSTDASTGNDEVSLTKGEAPGTVGISGMATGSTVILRVPYEVESNLPQISVGIDFTYTTEEGTFTILSNPILPAELALDVTVHDLFRAECLYSRFQIRASQGTPLHILSVDLEGSSGYTVEGPSSGLTPMLVSPNQDGNILYKVRPRGESSADREVTRDESPLLLSITYAPLTGVIQHNAQRALADALVTSEHARFSKLLQHGLASSLQHLPPSTLEQISLLNEFPLPPYALMNWPSLLSHLPAAPRGALSSWLKAWHSQHETLALPDAAHLDSTTIQTILIQVPLPRLHILHSTSLTLCLPSSQNPPHLSQGTPVRAILRTCYTTRWAPPPSPPSIPATHSRDFQLEISDPQDAWMLAGPRRCTFSLAETDSYETELLLIPLRTGRLLLPSVEIRAVAPPAARRLSRGSSVSAATGTGAVGMMREERERDTDEDVRCATDYRSAGSCVLVLSGVTAVTAAAEEGLVGGGRIVTVLACSTRGGG